MQLEATKVLKLGALVALVAGACAATPARPVEPAAAPSLTGTWTLVAADELRADGTRVASYGEHPRGLLIVDPDGRYSLQIYRDERPRFAAGTKGAGTPEEFRAALMGTSSHIGRCAIVPGTDTLQFQIERSSYPNWDGTEQLRKFTLVGDELSYQVPASAANTGATPISVWHRIRR